VQLLSNSTDLAIMEIGVFTFKLLEVEATSNPNREGWLRRQVLCFSSQNKKIKNKKTMEVTVRLSVVVHYVHSSTDQK